MDSPALATSAPTEKLKLSPVIFGGSEVAQAARAILSFEVPFITVNDGVAFKDIDSGECDGRIGGSRPS